jgi:hypothetical protein
MFAQALGNLRLALECGEVSPLWMFFSPPERNRKGNRKRRYLAALQSRAIEDMT